MSGSGGFYDKDPTIGGRKVHFLTLILDIRTALPYSDGVKIKSVRHRGLKRLIEDDDTREIRADQINRVRNILAALIVADDIKGVTGPPGWRIHQMTGDRAGTWSFSVTGNWRVTFTLEQGEICNLNLEDYH